MLPPPKFFGGGKSSIVSLSLFFLALKRIYDKRCLSLNPLRRRSLLTRNLSVLVDAVLLRASSRQIERILRPLVPGTLCRASSSRTRVVRGNERER